MTSYRTALSRARGLGSAKHGVGAFIAQRVSAIALVLLTLWGVWSALAMAGGDYEGALSWMQSPLNAVLLSLLIGAGVFHMQIGMREIIADYLARPLTRSACMVLNVFVCWLVGATGVFCVLKVALTAGVH
jgi:succinate dehydrogenase / fumarate reductase membrane anchor subunit